VVLDAAAVGGAARGHVVEPEPVEDGGNGLDQMRGPEHVAAQVEHHVVPLAVARGLEQPGPILLLREEVVGEPDLAEVLAVVEAHGDTECITAGRGTDDPSLRLTSLRFAGARGMGSDRNHPAESSGGGDGHP
jgi:hypothetical protein